LSAWVSDRAAGLDAIMIAPTRHLVAQLNRRASAHRLNHSTATAEVPLADGNWASVGDVIITRNNDRRLRLGANDWLKNGDRWTITHVAKQGDLTVRHNRSQVTVRLPIAYVRESTGLGYATTIHSAQGVSADTMHGLVTGPEFRQQLYTMITRGRYANHLYLQVVGDGDPHTLIRPDTISPRTPTETLQQIIARDEAPTSSSTVRRELNNPAARLFQAVQRYTDSLHVAAEQRVGPGPSQSSAKPTTTSPDSPPNPPGQPLAHDLADQNDQDWLLRDDLAWVEVPARVHRGEQAVDHLNARSRDGLLQPPRVLSADGVMVRQRAARVDEPPLDGVLERLGGRKGSRYGSIRRPPAQGRL
jgi:hypothetical protein